MAGIQAGINQLLTTAGVFANLSPELRAKAEDRAQRQKLSRQSSKAAEAFAVSKQKAEGPLKNFRETEVADLNTKISKMSPKEASLYTANLETNLEALDEPIAAAQKMADVAQAQWELDPSKETLSKLRHLQTQAKGQVADKDLLTRKYEALAKMREKGNAQVEQNYSFKDLINDISKAEQEGYPNG